MIDGIGPTIYYHFNGDPITVADAILERMESLQECRDVEVYMSKYNLQKEIFNNDSRISEIEWMAWSENYVYFPMYKQWSICWIGYVPRNPCDFKMAANCENLW